MKAAIRNLIFGVLCLLPYGIQSRGQSSTTNVSTSSSMVESGKDIGIDRYILSAIHNNVERLREWRSVGGTNSNKNASVDYSPEKIDATLEWYRALKDSDGKQIDKKDIEQALVYAKVLSSVDGKQEDALAIFDALLKSELERHERRQIQAETGSLLIRLATDSKDDERKQYLRRAKKIADELLWIQDLWFGRALAILAHIYLLEGDFDRAIKLLDDFSPQLTPPDNDKVKMGLITEARYVVAVAMHEKAKLLIALNGDESEILKLLIGERNLTGAFVHFMNVAIRYPDSEWAADSAQRAAAISYVLDKRYGRRVRL